MAKLYSLLSLVFIVHIVAYGRFTVVGFWLDWSYFPRQEVH
jgi:hypothetical protein